MQTNRGSIVRQRAGRSCKRASEVDWPNRNFNRTNSPCRTNNRFTVTVTVEIASRVNRNYDRSLYASHDCPRALVNAAHLRNEPKPFMVHFYTIYRFLLSFLSFATVSGLHLLSYYEKIFSIRIFIIKMNYQNSSFRQLLNLRYCNNIEDFQTIVIHFFLETLKKGVRIHAVAKIFARFHII